MNNEHTTADEPDSSLETRHSSRAIKQQRVRDFLQQRKLDGILLTLQSNFAWYTDGGRSYVNVATEESIADLLVTKTEEHLYVNTTESARLKKEELPFGVHREHLHAWWDEAEQKELLGRRIESDAGSLRSEFARLRYSLLPNEIERYRELGKDVADAFWDAVPSLLPGISEVDLAATMSFNLMAKGIYPLVLLVAFDERIRSYRHPLPTENKLRSLAMIGVCGRRGGLVASASRLYSLGALSPELRRLHPSVCKVDAWLLRNTLPGKRIADVFKGLQEQYARVGYPHEWQLHHQGGATGYATRDYRATETSIEVVQNNQAFAWNPTITGTKSEDTILVNERGFDILTYDARWPVLEFEVQESVIQRPDILVVD